MKRFISIFLCFLLVMSMMPISALAEGTTGDVDADTAILLDGELPEQNPVQEEEPTPEEPPEQTMLPEPSIMPEPTMTQEPSITPEMTVTPVLTPTVSPEVEAPVFVTEIRLTLTLPTGVAMLTPAGTAQLAVSVEPENATDHTVTFAAEPEGIVTLSENGAIVALTEGETVITATANDGSGISGNIVITVVEAQTFAFEGKGTKETPFLLQSVEELLQLAALVNAGTEPYATAYYKLTADVDLIEAEWTPIGTETYPFAGTFDGNNHIVHMAALTELPEGVEARPTGNCSAMRRMRSFYT